ncbi:MAG: AAA family ATPase [Kiritimatiellaeota bacterium]|nr:AAA family ATPase [Kiritimatiellota bacterium]
MTVRIAIAGKGGSGKTTISALLCRVLIENGLKPLLAVDADPNSCLPDYLGLPVSRTIGEMREQLREDPSSVPVGVSKQEWIEQLIHEDLTEAPGLDMLVMGQQEGPGCYCYINNVLRDCIAEISGHYRAMVIDNEAGLEHLSRRTNGMVDIMLVACPPNIIGARTAGRVIDMIKRLKLEVGRTFLVLNPCDRPPEPAVAETFAATGIEIVAGIPTDPALGAFDVQGRPLMELPEDSTALNAVRDLVALFRKRRWL